MIIFIADNLRKKGLNKPLQIFMKKKIIFIFTLLFGLIYSQDSKDIVVFYNYSYKIDSTDNFNNYNDIMALVIRGKESIYKSYNRIKRDSTVESNLKNGIYEVNFAKMPKVHIFHQVYYNNQKDSTKILDKIVNKEFSYEPKTKLNWVLGKEKKKIGDYDCQNAYCYIGKRKFTAWFTSSILLNDGPYRFKGLPGLILEVYDEKKYFHFNFVGLKNFQIPLNFSIKAIEVSEEKFLKLRSDFFKDPVGQSQIYMGKPISEENKQRVLNNFKDNLFLEN